jgi:Lon protease-like protein
MGLFARKPYKSEITSFIEDLKTRRPALEAEQRAGRALLWDRAQDREALSDWRDARVAQQPYVYQTKT